MHLSGSKVNAQMIAVMSSIRGNCTCTFSIFFDIACVSTGKGKMQLLAYGSHGQDRALCNSDQAHHTCNIVMRAYHSL